MNRKLIGIIVAVVLILLAGGAFVLSSKKTENLNLNANLNTNSQPNAVTEVQAPGQKSLKELLASGQSVKCDFKDASDNTIVEGTTYVSGGKARGDFSTTSGSQTFKGHMIAEAQTSYFWMDESKMGFKISLSSPAPAASGGSKQGLDSDKKMDFKCAPWSADSSKFELPKDIKFSDMGALTPKTPSASAQPDSKANNCSVCDNVPAEGQAQCKAALGC